LLSSRKQIATIAGEGAEKKGTLIDTMEISMVVPQETKDSTSI
jgi:hypothetical protein